uniref:Uncharacterized protein n=1 Tax=viral metagenome TaxID=1070528 RepID=A0A6M3JBG0_9ZZZZ
MFIRSTPGFWPDFYACREDNIVETINRMLKEHAKDYPNTCCIGFTITRKESLIKIWPKVRCSKFIMDFYTGEKKED